MAISLHSFRPNLTRPQLAFALGMMLALCLSGGLRAQEEEDEPKLPDPEDVSFTSSDNVVVKATYWEPKEPGKSTVPIILLHGWEGKRQEFDVLGRSLQERYHHAVIAIDLRGHGGSMTVRAPNAAEDIEIKPERMGKDDFISMYRDVQAAKKFLVKKHREGKLNIEMLTVVGADMGAIVALNFAYDDWSRRQVPAKIYKNGHDVQGLVLLSPPRSFRGMSSELALKHPIVRSRLSTMIIVGANDNKAYKDARSLNATLERHHVRIPDDATKAEELDKKDLFLIAPKTSLQGTKLLANALKTDQMIAQFIQARLTNKSDEFAWADREER